MYQYDASFRAAGTGKYPQRTDILKGTHRGGAGYSADNAMSSLQTSAYPWTVVRDCDHEFGLACLVTRHETKAEKFLAFIAATCTF